MDGAITSWSWAGGSPTSMIQQAKEELEILEAQYPNRFGYLKLELKSFISLVESQNMTEYTSTQASSTEKKRKNVSNDFEKVRRKVSNVEAIEKESEKVKCDGQVTKRKRIDEVMKRAQACLNKIQMFKTSF